MAVVDFELYMSLPRFFAVVWEREFRHEREERRRRLWRLGRKSHDAEPKSANLPLGRVRQTETLRLRSRPPS